VRLVRRTEQICRAASSEACGLPKLVAVVAVVGCSVVLAACGSASKSASTSSTGSGSNSTSPTLAFSTCMRSHGVPSFPDLSNKGMEIEANAQTISVNGVSVNAPAFLAARQECQKYLPHQQATPAQAAQQRQRGLHFANCMRSHGVPNFPDPKVVSSHGGNQVAYLPGINPQSPAFQAAAKACGGGPKGP
jgi:hypothetical protein